MTDLHLAPLAFDGALVVAATWVLAVAGAWAGLLVAAAVVETVTGGRVVALARVGCPTAWRPALLYALGTALAVLGVSPAHAAPEAAPGPLLDVPSRPLGGAPATRAATDRVVVAPGDSLWGLARGRLAPGTPDVEVAAYAARLHHANRAVIGADPDLIRPGQLLVLPVPTPDAPTREDPTP